MAIFHSYVSLPEGNEVNRYYHHHQLDGMVQKYENTPWRLTYKKYSTTTGYTISTEL